MLKLIRARSIAGSRKIIEQVLPAQRDDLVLVLVSGGRLAKMLALADVHALILSDVPGDDVSTIASGPTAADNSTFADARGEIKETPKPDDSCFNQVTHALIASNRISLQATRQLAAKLGYDVLIYSEQLMGEAICSGASK